MENSKSVLKEQLPVFLAELLLCGIMVGVFAAIGRFSTGVLLGASIGTAVSLLNHLVLILSLLRAERSDTPQGGQLRAQGSMLLRFLIMIGVLVLALKFLHTEPFATLLPLILMRIALFVGGLFVKKSAVPEERRENDL